MRFVVKIVLCFMNLYIIGLGKGVWYFILREELFDNLVLNDFCFFLRISFFFIVDVLINGDNFIFKYCFVN